MARAVCCFRSSTLRRVNVEALLIAAGQNLKRLCLSSGTADPRSRLRWRPYACQPSLTAGTGWSAAPSALTSTAQKDRTRHGADETVLYIQGKKA
jgi:hypothetical protein